MTQDSAVAPGRSPAQDIGAGIARPSFSEEVRGVSGKPVDLTMARIMDDLYDETFGRPTGQSVDGFTRLSDERLRKVGIDPAGLDDAKSGFKARLYCDAEGRVVLAYSGTDEGKDWLTNFGQGLGFETAQYNQAMALARQAKVAFGDDVVITGHSLGGGLAGAAAVATDTPAVTFNAAGVHDKTMSRIGLDPDAAALEAESGLIRRYAVKNEILTDLQERTPIMRSLMPDAIGHKIELPDPDPLSFWQKLNPVKSTRHAVDMHYIDAVIDAMEKTGGQRTAGANMLMSDKDHPLNAQYERSLQQVQAVEREAGKPFDAQTQNLSGALALASERAGIVPDRVALADNGRAFAIQGATPETQRFAHVDTAVAADTPLIESSRQGLALHAQRSAEQQPALSPDASREQAAAPRAMA
jgi:hypothetical protein